MKRRYAICAMLLVAPLVWAEFTMERIEVNREGDRFLLDAQIGYELNTTTVEALDNGVPLTFETHIQVRRDGAWVWEKDIVEHRLRQTLQLDPLSSLYEVKDLQTGEVQRFASQEAALGAMGELDDVNLVDSGRLNTSEFYLVEVRSYLDVEALPLPLRPLAHLSSDWDLESEVWQWQLRP